MTEMGWDDPHRGFDDDYPDGFIVAMRTATFQRAGKGGHFVLSVDEELAEWIAN